MENLFLDGSEKCKILVSAVEFARVHSRFSQSLSQRIDNSLHLGVSDLQSTNSKKENLLSMFNKRFVASVAT